MYDLYFNVSITFLCICSVLTNWIRFSNTLRKLLFPRLSLFHSADWRDNWCTGMLGLYTDYISMLISRQQPQILTQTVKDWTDVSDEYFDQGFVTMLSTHRDVITLNMIQLLHQVLDSSADSQLNLTGDKFKSKKSLMPRWQWGETPTPS